MVLWLLPARMGFPRENGLLSAVIPEAVPATSTNRELGEG